MNLVRLFPGISALLRFVVVEGITAQYLKSAAEVEHKTPAEVIGELVREKISASA
jgi:hypothetical protein